MHVVAVVNRKGGVGKTTTAVNVAAALALGGLRVLLLDLDPQGSVGHSLRLAPADGEGSSLLFRSKPAVRPLFLDLPATTRLGIVPADAALADEEARLLDEPRRRDRLGRSLTALRESWNVAILDTPPALGALTDAALRAANAVLLPAAAEYLALESLRSAVEAVRAAERRLDRRYAPFAVLPTLVESRRGTTGATLALLREQVGPLLLGPEIPRSARIDAAALSGVPVVVGSPAAPVARAYRAAARELFARLGDSRAANTRRGSVKAFVKTNVRAELARLRRAR